MDRKKRRKKEISASSSEQDVESHTNSIMVLEGSQRESQTRWAVVRAVTNVSDWGRRNGDREKDSKC
jgi:hypothetical protein